MAVAKDLSELIGCNDYGQNDIYVHLPVLRPWVFIMTVHLSWADLYLLLMCCWSNSSCLPELETWHSLTGFVMLSEVSVTLTICEAAAILSDWKQDWADELQAGVWQQFTRKYQLQRPAVVLTSEFSDAQTLSSTAGRVAQVFHVC